MRYTVLIKDGTIGTIGTINNDTLGEQPANDLIGKVVNVHLSDENGNPIEVRGELVEVLEESEY